MTLDEGYRLLAASAFWYLAGYWTCALSRAFTQWRERRTMPNTPTRHPRHWVPDLGRLPAWLIVVLAIITTVVSSWGIHRQAEQITCQTRFNAVFITALQHRAEANTQTNAATATALKHLLVLKPQDARAGETRVILQQYLDSIASADEKREDTPFPPQPSC